MVALNNMNESNLMSQSPIIVFGTGGSGTRVVTDILRKAGCFIGYNINDPLDNQDFGFLLSGRIDWMVNNFPFNGNIAFPYLAIFKKVFFYQPISVKELIALYMVTAEYISGRSRGSFRRRPISERLIRGSRLIKAVMPGTSVDLRHYQKWAFKSPEAIYFIGPIIDFFRDVKIIHLIRDGRDMVFSKNRSRLQYLEMFKNKHKDPFKSQLCHWGAINTWALHQGEKRLSEKQYLLIRYEDLCADPESTVDKILFLSEMKYKNKDDLYNIPQKNPSINRWQEHTEYLKDIDDTDLKRFGYT